MIREVGGFDETMTWGGEDTELAHRLIEAGKRIAFVPTSIVVHPARTSFAEFVSWSYRRGRAKRQFARRVAIAGYVRRRLASYGRIIVAHLTDSKVLLIVPLLLVNLVLQEAGFVAETISPTKPPSEPQH